MRLVFVNSSRIWGGNEKWTCEAAAGLASRGHDVVLVGQSDVMEERAGAYGLRFERLRLRGDGDIVGVLRLSRRFKSFCPDAVVLTKSKEYWLGGLAAKLAGVERIFFRIGIDRPVQTNLKYRLLFGKICDTFIVNAGSVRDILLRAPFIAKDRIAVIRNGVSLDGVRARSRRPGRGPVPGFAASVGIPPGAEVVGAIGRLAKQKGFDVLLEAFAQVGRERPGAFLVIAGEGHERKDLARRVKRLGLEEAVSLPGFVEDMDSFYESLTVFALPSRFEGMPNVVLEAMAAGVPVVATDVSGVGEIVEDGVTGRLVPPEDSERLAGALLDLLGDARERRSLRENALSLVRREFNLERMIDELDALIRGEGAKGAEAAAARAGDREH